MRDSGPPSLRLGAVLQGLLTALAAAASTPPLTLALAATTVVTALIAGAKRGLWSRLTQLAGLSTIVAATVAAWPLVNRLAWKQPVTDEALAMALPGALVALQSLRLVIKARGSGRSTTAPTTTPTTAAVPARGVVGLAVGMAVVVATEFALMLWQVGPAWGWLLRNPRSWLVVALLLVAVVDGVMDHRRPTGVIAVGLAFALAVLEMLSAWPLRFVVVHDVLVLGRVVAAGVVVLLALALLVRVARRSRRVAEPGASP